MMVNHDIVIEKLNNCCVTLTPDDIFEIDKNDNGPINKVITRIERHCFGVQLLDDQFGLTAEMFYINHDDSLKGYLIQIDLNDRDYFYLLLHFCVFLADNFKEVDALTSFNIFQDKLRGFLEKLGFFTITNLEIEKFKGKNAVMATTSKRGIFKLDFIDKPQFYRDFFKDSYKEFTEGIEYVYLMLNSDTSLIKIGTSKNPGYRERTLHSKEPKVYLIALWECKKSVEKELHKKYSHKKIRGEWFRLTIKELIEIDEFMKEKTTT
ncbi:MAG: GIY-YIG nuclease family protein [Saprospiraceae bacterium]|nr:GIY-YIG nuclease family protein [Saprospiraceae bacterium]